MDMMHSIFYATIDSKIDPRRRKEKADARMIREDHTAMANLPQEGFQRVFTSANMGKSPWLDDDIG